MANISMDIDCHLRGHYTLWLRSVKTKEVVRDNYHIIPLTAGTDHLGK